MSTNRSCLIVFIPVIVCVILYLCAFAPVHKYHNLILYSPPITMVMNRGASREVQKSNYQVPKLYYLHIPKTGSSIWREMIQYMCPTNSNDQINYIYRTVEHRNAINVSFINRSCASSIKPGHRPLRTLPNETVTLIRNPLDRIVSGFLHNMHDCKALQSSYQINEHDGRRKKIRDNFCPGIKAYARKDNVTHGNFTRNVLLSYINCVSGCATNMLSGKKCETRPHTLYSPSIGRVMDSLAFVGVTNRWNETVCTWHHWFPRLYSNDSYLSSTMNRVMPGQFNECKKDLKTILIREFEQLIERDPDWILYNRSLELLEQRLPAHCRRRASVNE
eukprot:110644_1